MAKPRVYSTAEAFRTSLEERLKRSSLAARIEVVDLRRQVAFDRLLARLFLKEPAPWALKGGYAMELRLKAARSTVDIDLTMQRLPAGATERSDANRIVRDLLQRAADGPLGDWFKYTIGSATMDLTAAPYGGARYPVDARMDSRTFARFHLDVGIGDMVIEPLETVE